MKINLQIDVMTKAMSDLVTNFVNVVPKILIGILLFVIGIIISKIISKIVKKAFSKIGVDKLGEKLKEIDIVQKSNIDIKISDILSKFIYYFVLLFFAVAAASVLGIPEISQLVSDILTFIPNLIVALIILILGTLLADGLRKFMHTALNSLGVTSAGLISSILFYFLFINIVIIALSQSGVDTDFLSQNISIIIGGIVLAFAIGYGLASKDVMANMVASFYNKGKFQIGDQIEIEGIRGVVTDVNKSSLELKNKDGKVVIPLSVATSKMVKFLE